MAESDLVVVGTYLDHIDAMILSDDCGGLRPHLWMGGVELLVRDEDAVVAQDVLATDAAE